MEPMNGQLAATGPTPASNRQKRNASIREVKGGFIVSLSYPNWQHEEVICVTPEDVTECIKNFVSQEK